MDDFPTAIRKAEAARRIGLCARQLERLEQAGRFPRRIRLSANSVGYIEREVADWLNERIAARDQHAA